MKYCIYIVTIILIHQSFGLVIAQESPDTTAVLFDAVSVNAYQVSSTLRKIPGSLSVLNSDDIKVSDETNLTDALNTIPGVSAQSGTYTTNRIVIRGMGSRTPYNTNRLKMYINDIPFTSSDGLSSPEELDVLSFNRIELVKGPSSALYGSGLGGSLNLYTPADTGTKVTAISQYGSYNTWKANILGTLHPGKFDIWRNISHLQSDGYRENSKYQRTSMFNTAHWNGSKFKADGLLLLTRVRGNLPSSLGYTEFHEDPEKAAPNWLLIKGYKKYFRVIGGIAVNFSNSPRFTNKLIIFGKGIYNYEKRPFNNLKDHSIGAGIRDKFTLHMKNLEWVTGTEIYVERYTWSLDTNGVRINKNRERRNQYNIFSVWYYHPHPKWNISAAGALNFFTYRLVDLFENNGSQTGARIFPIVFSPRLGVNYAPNHNIAFYASAGHGFSLPSPEETLLPEGSVNKDIMPEKGVQFELGARLSLFGNALVFDGNVYWIEVKDLLVTKRLTEDVFTGVNAGHTRHIGFEALLVAGILQYQSFPGNLSLFASYTQSGNSFIDFQDNGVSYDGNRLPGIPAEIAYIRLKWNPVKPFELITEIRHQGKQYLNDNNILSYEGYEIANIRLNSYISLRKAGNLNIYGGIDNAGNTRFASMVVANAIGFNNSEPRYYYPGLPRTAYIGMRYAYDF